MMDGAKLWCALRPFTVSMWAEEGVIADRAGASERVAILWIDKAQISLRAGHARDLAGWLLGWLAEHAPEERAKLSAPPAGWSGALSEAIAAERDALREQLDAATDRPGCLTDYYAQLVREVYPDLPEKYTPANVYLAVRRLAEARDHRAAALDEERQKVDGLTAQLDEARESLRIRTADRDSLETEWQRARTERDAREKDLAAIADAVGLGGTRTRYEGQLLGKVENLIADVSDLRAANRTLTDANRELRAVLAEVPAQREAAAVATFEAVRAAFAGCEVVIRVPEVTRG